MKINELILLETFYKPSQRKKLKVILNLLQKKDMSGCKHVLQEHIEEVSTDFPEVKQASLKSFWLVVLMYQKSLRNRLRAFDAQDSPTEKITSYPNSK